MHRHPIALLSILATLAAACGDDASDDPGLLDRTAAALGGADAILATSAEHVEATATRLDPGEAYTSREAVQSAELTYDLFHRFDEDRVHVDLVATGDFLVPFTMDYTIVIDGRHGSLEGLASLFDPTTDPRPLLAAQLTTRLKHDGTTSLLATIRRALADPEAVTEEEDVELDGRAYHVLAIAAAEHPPLRVLIDPATARPAAVQTIEHAPPLGDTVVTVRFDDFRAVGDLLLPHALTIDVDGLEIHHETRSMIELDPSEPTELYTVAESLQIPFDEAAGHRGWISTQYLLGYELLGLPFLFVPPTDVTLAFAELSPGVFHVRGPSHNVLLIEMADHLVLVDAPLEETYADQLHAAIAARFPAKPIRTVVASHFHYDHTGGIRRFAAGGDLTVVAGADSVGFYDAVFANPYSVAPDLYAASPRPVTIEGVDESLVLTDGARTVEVHHIDSAHAADMVIVYLPAEKVLFNSDLWSPEQGPLVGYFRVGASDLLEGATALGLPMDTVVAGAHSPATGTLAQLAELLADE